MIKKCLILLCVIIFSCSEKQKTQKLLTQETKEELKLELKKMLEADQLNRSYLSIGTLNRNLIDSLDKLPVIDQIKFTQTHTSELSKDQKDSLWSIQHEIDLKNTNLLYEIIEEHGWLSKTQLDSVVDPMVFLFHTPEETIEKMQSLLFKEVQEKRMKPIKFAMYVDNMRKKAFGKSQLYGTGNEFDPNTNSIVPPYIVNIDSTNMERLMIGLPKLKEGEYRLAK